MIRVEQIKCYAADCHNEASLARDEKVAKALHEAARAALNFALAIQAVDALRGEPFS